jgi:hypothetical protein
VRIRRMHRTILFSAKTAFAAVFGVVLGGRVHVLISGPESGLSGLGFRWNPNNASH